MKQIWKFRVNTTIQMPMEAKILTVQLQDGEPMMWLVVDTENELESRKFTIVGTGNSFDDKDAKYIGTFQEPPFVWHLFEIVH